MSLRATLSLMSKQQVKSGIKTRDRILDVLPANSFQVAKELRINWETARKSLYRLRKAGKISLSREGIYSLVEDDDLKAFERLGKVSL